MLAMTTLRRIARRVPFARAAKCRLVRAIWGPPPESSSQPPEYYRVYLREVLANEFLRGEGIEIGALHAPLRVPDGAKVRYVDRLGLDGLREHYPVLATMPVVPVDVVDDGERLHTFADESQDFIIANHFLEHTQDPIGTLRRFLAVLNPGGVLFLAIPDKRWTFDIERPLTTLDHLDRDHEEGPVWSYVDHMYEYSRKIHKFSAAKTETHVQWMIDVQYSIHFHVWTHDTFLDFLFHVRGHYGMPFTLAAAILNQSHAESIAVLRKPAAGEAA
jgi:predicted SAM-dependent methyltransferase